MPELPEVETIRRGLAARLVGLKITKTSVLESKSWQVTDNLMNAIENHAVVAVNRRAKLLMLDLDSDFSLLCHLKMTGQMIYRNEADKSEDFAAGHPTDSFVHELPDRSTRVILEFSDGSHLFFNDQRKFGWLKLVKTAEIVKESFVAGLGPEIVDFTQAQIPEKIDKATMTELLARTKRHQNAPIKAVILDQKVVSGIGNIYADEGLWSAKIHPATRVKMLKDSDLRRLYEAVREVMTRSIDSGGSTMATYVRADGSKGNYLELFANVFRREGQACPRCGSEIIKTKVAGRGTHICPKCQKIKE